MNYSASAEVAKTDLTVNLGLSDPDPDPLAPIGRVFASNLSPTLPFSNSNGMPIPVGTGFIIAGGITGMSDDEIRAISGSNERVTLSDAFKPFGDVEVFGPTDGFFDAEFVNGNELEGQPIYLVAGDGDWIDSSSSLVVVKSNQLFDCACPVPWRATVSFDPAESTILLGAIGRGVDFPGMGQIDVLVGASVPEPTWSCGFLLGVLLVVRRGVSARNP